MNVSVNWLSALLGRDIDPADAAHRLAMQAAPIDTVLRVHEGLEDIVVGLVTHVEKHPDADKLTVCQVNDGTDTIDVVCGAPNVEAGKKYPYARVGTTLPDGPKLKAKPIRGVVSNGMLLSERELGLGPDHAGILELNTEADPGAPLADAMPLLDTRIEIDVPPNRPDLLGHKGVARELAATYGEVVKLEPIPGGADALSPNRTAAAGLVDGVEVSIDDTAGCPRYIAAVIRGVRVGTSPAWLEARLRAVGSRPINNIVDATNYVLYELNQPMHAFDLAKLSGPKIIVRRARPTERLVTLDGENRALTADMTMICDADGPTAIAGVMGGAESEVTEDTTDVLLECAYFDPKRTRATAKTLRMSTDASYRFERGTDIHGMTDVVRRAVSLVIATAGGEERDAPIDVYPKPVKSRTVFLRPDRLEHLLGTPISTEEAERHLVSVGFIVAPKNGRLAAQVPGWRPDVTREVDLIEEVARLYGYDTFPVEIRAFRPSTVPEDPIEAVKATLRSALTSAGLYEARSLSFVSDVGDDVQAVLNPLSVEEANLRPELMSPLCRSVQRNWAARERTIRLFEIGNVFTASGKGQLPAERLRVAGIVTGTSRPPHWTTSGKVADVDVWDVKALFDTVIALCGIAGEARPANAGWSFIDAAGQTRGWAGPLAIDRPPWAGATFGFEVDVVAGKAPSPHYVPISVTPAVERDVALVLPGTISAAEVEKVMRRTAGTLLEAVHVFDEYRSREVDGRSVAWRLVFRSPERTLKDREVDKRVTKMLQHLEEQLGVKRRQA